MACAARENSSDLNSTAKRKRRDCRKIEGDALRCQLKKAREAALHREGKALASKIHHEREITFHSIVHFAWAATKLLIYSTRAATDSSETAL